MGYISSLLCLRARTVHAGSKGSASPDLAESFIHSLRSPEVVIRHSWAGKSTIYDGWIIDDFRINTSSSGFSQPPLITKGYERFSLPECGMVQYVVQYGTVDDAHRFKTHSSREK